MGLIGAKIQSGQVRASSIRVSKAPSSRTLELACRMPRIASSVGPTYIHDLRLRPLHLDLQCSDERVVSIHNRVL